MAAAGNRQLGPKGQLTTRSRKNIRAAPPNSPTRRAVNVTGSGLTNVRVNDPSEDSHFMDQTTQSETTIGVHGSNVVVGFNDSQKTLLALTAASNLTGYAYSTNGGSTFTDAGSLPNAPAFNNFGDPWLGTDLSGNYYYSNLMLDGTTGNLDIGVAKSTDGGKTFSAPRVVSPSNDAFYFGDKDALAVGRDPARKTRDDIYVAWDDQFADQNFNFFTGLPVARSTDGGKTWHVTYADKVPADTTGCSFTQYIGATPAVAPRGPCTSPPRRSASTTPAVSGWRRPSASGSSGRTTAAKASTPASRSRPSPRPATSASAGHGDAEPRVPVDRGRSERHRLRRLERRHPATATSASQPRPTPAQLDRPGPPGNPDKCSPPSALTAGPPPPLLPTQHQQHARRDRTQLTTNPGIVHHHAGRLGLVPGRVHGSAVRPDHRLRLYGRLHRQRDQRDHPLLRLGRQPRHDQEFPLASRSP